jgi:hypothetical protein
VELNLFDLRVGYVDVVRLVLDRGEPVGPRGLLTKELRNVTLICPADAVMLPIGVGRGVSLKLAALEALQLISGTSRHDLVQRAAPGFDGVLVDPEHAAYGAYGPRIADQLPRIVNLLREDPDTRRAVVSIWREEDLSHQGDRPCTIFFQFLIRHNRLEMYSRMRSQDALLGLAYDAFAGAQLRDTLARQLEVAPGRWYHTVTSLHVYERDHAMVYKLRPPEPGQAAVAARLPRGVNAGDLRHSPAWAAQRLLTGDFDSYLAGLNPWYVEQLGKIGVHQQPSGVSL